MKKHFKDKIEHKNFSVFSERPFNACALKNISNTFQKNVDKTNCQIAEIGAVQKNADLVDLEKC